MKPITRIAFYLVSLLATLALVLTAVEMGFTFFRGCAPSGIAWDRTLGWRLTRNQKWRYQSQFEEIRVEAHTNAFGFRDGDHAAKKLPGQKRILFLGDSYTVGLEYPTDSIFTRRFSEALRQTPEATNRFDVMKAAIPAWATDQQYLYLRNEGIAYRPDYVILMVAPNDIRESYGKKFFSLDRERLVHNGPKSVPLKDKVLWFLANHFCAFHYWQQQNKSAYGSFADVFRHFPASFAVGSETASEKHLFLREVPAEIKAAKELFYGLLLAMQKLCRENSAKLLLSIIPTKLEYDGTLNDNRYQSGKIARDLEMFAAAHNIPFLNLVTALASETRDPLEIFIANEYHLNNAGHTFIAKHLVPFFKANQ